MYFGMDTTRQTTNREAKMNDGGLEFLKNEARIDEAMDAADAAKIDVEVQAWSGNVRPWRATVRVGGRFAGRTGFCSSPERARRAGEEMGQRAAEATREAVEERKTWEVER
jgi:hypothetical protein